MGFIPDQSFIYHLVLITSRNSRKTAPEKYLNFGTLHKSEVAVCARPDSFGLFNGQSFHKPSELLASKELNFFGVSGPLISAAVKTLYKKHKAVLVEMESLNGITLSTTEQI